MSESDTSDQQRNSHHVPDQGGAGHEDTPADGVIVRPHYQTAHAQITEPARFVTMSHYYRRRWLRHVGPVGTAILLELRGRCYNNPNTGERRDTVVAAQKELADSIGISVDTLQRQLGKPGREDDPRANDALRRFVWTEERYERGGAGRVRQLENVYHVAMDDPIHPDDEEQLEALIQEHEQQAREETERRRQGRKRIIPAAGTTTAAARTGIMTQETDPKEDCSRRETGPGPQAGPPEPQIAVLRQNPSAAPPPEPQIAVGGYRNLRQGLPQIAVPLKNRLLFITREEFTSETLNVREEVQTAFSSTELEASFTTDTHTLVEELKDWGSERRHLQLLSICDRHGLSHLPQQALKGTRERLSKERKLGPLERPGAYYQSVLIKLLEEHQIFVPTLAEKASDDPEQVRRLARASLGLDPPGYEQD